MANKVSPEESRDGKTSVLQAFYDKYRELYPGRPLDFAMPLPLSLSLSLSLRSGDRKERGRES